MLVYVGGRYAVTLQKAVTQQVPCEKCGTVYGYQVVRRASGTGVSPYYTDNEGAKRRAYQNAHANLHAAIVNGIDIIPCPNCGSFQAKMVNVLRSRKLGWVLPAGLIAAIFGGLLLFLSLITRDPNPAVVAVTALIMLGGIALLFLKPYLGAKFNPNADCAARVGRPVQGVFVIPRASSITVPGQGFVGQQPDAYAAPNESPVWYYVKNDQQIGPLTASAMRERAAGGELQPADLVWKSGMPDWVAASGVKELFTAGRPARGAVPPPLPVMAQPFVPPGPLPAPAARSRGMPVWGWVLIAVGVVLLLGLAIPVVSRVNKQTNRTTCANNMRLIGVALANYASTHSGNYPATAADLFVNSTLDPGNFICPSGTEYPAPGSTRQEQAANLTGSHLSYVYVANGVDAATATRSSVMLYENPDVHDNEGMNILFGDGHVEFVDLPHAQQWIHKAQAKLAAADRRRSRVPPASPPPQPQAVSAAAPVNVRPPVMPAAPLKGIRTAIVGGNGGSSYTDYSARGENVLGFRYEMADWGGQSVVRELQPLYGGTIDHSDSSNRLKTIRARDGYVVGGMMVDGKDNANAIRILFVRWDGEKTIPQDNYLSDWLGKPIDNHPIQLAGHGERVIGICGRKGMNFDALGLVVLP